MNKSRKRKRNKKDGLTPRFLFLINRSLVMRDVIIGVVVVLLFMGFLISIAMFVSQVLASIGTTVPVIIVVAITVFWIVVIVYRIIEVIIRNLK